MLCSGNFQPVVLCISIFITAYFIEDNKVESTMATKSHTVKLTTTIDSGCLRSFQTFAAHWSRPPPGVHCTHSQSSAATPSSYT